MLESKNKIKNNFKTNESSTSFAGSRGCRPLVTDSDDRDLQDSMNTMNSTDATSKKFIFFETIFLFLFLWILLICWLFVFEIFLVRFSLNSLCTVSLPNSNSKKNYSRREQATDRSSGCDANTNTVETKLNMRTDTINARTRPDYNQVHANDTPVTHTQLTRSDCRRPVFLAPCRMLSCIVNEYIWARKAKQKERIIVQYIECARIYFTATEFISLFLFSSSATAIFEHIANARSCARLRLDRFALVLTVASTHTHTHPVYWPNVE